MSVSTRSKGYLDVQNVENWKYTTTNNLKRFSSKDEAKRFVIGTSNIWKLDTYKNGATFVENLVRSIDLIHAHYVTGMEYIDNKGDVCYILFSIEQSADQKSIQISLTQQKLSKSGARTNASDNVAVEECNTGRWLMQRAYVELHLPEQTMSEMVLPSTHPHEHAKVEKFTAEQNKLKENQMQTLLHMDYSTTSSENPSYYVMDQKRHKKQFLKTIKEVQDFSMQFVRSEEFFDQLLDWCRTLQEPRRLSIVVQFLDGCKCTLDVSAIPQKEFIQLFITVRNSSMRS